MARALTAISRQQQTTIPKSGHDGRLNIKERPMFVAYILSRIRGHLRYRQDIRELTKLTDRHLEDVGISRHEIDTIASNARL